MKRAWRWIVKAIHCWFMGDHIVKKSRFNCLPVKWPEMGVCERCFCIGFIREDGRLANTRRMTPAEIAEEWPPHKYA